MLKNILLKGGLEDLLEVHIIAQILQRIGERNGIKEKREKRKKEIKKRMKKGREWREMPDIKGFYDTRHLFHPPSGRS